MYIFTLYFFFFFSEKIQLNYHESVLSILYPQIGPGSLEFYIFLIWLNYNTISHSVDHPPEFSIIAKDLKVPVYDFSCIVEFHFSVINSGDLNAKVGGQGGNIRWQLNCHRLAVYNLTFSAVINAGFRSF